MAEPIIFLAGIPGAGKSSYGRWLAETKGFTYIDMEHEGLDVQGFRASWNEFVSSLSTRFITELMSHVNPVCLDWGFPVRCLPLVRRLAEAGAEMWWFEAEKHDAKKYFSQRGTVPEANFETQMQGIESKRQEIMSLFGDRVIIVLNGQDGHLQNEVIYSRMSGSFKFYGSAGR